MAIMSTNFAWKHEYDVKLWRHKQRTPNTNDHHLPLNKILLMKIFCLRHCHWLLRHTQSRIGHTPYPPIGEGPRCHRGPKFQSRRHLASQRKLRFPKLEYETLEIREVRVLLKEKCITVIFGPFESTVFSHYNCCWGPFWKQSSPLIHCSCCWGPFESKVGYFAHCSCQGGSRQVPRLPSLKHTTVYKPDNDLIWEYETDWTRSASSDMRTFSPDVRM